LKILTVIGARPQFIKAAMVSRILREAHQEITLHTGQHYNANMSHIFFNELQIPEPDYNLGVGSGSHARQTAAMLVGVEDILLKEEPDTLMVYGDTNSTLAGALAAAKLHVPVIHVEAGLRSFNLRMPEEQNRILTDHLSSMLLCPTQAAMDNLHREGMTHNAHNVGDVMCDAVFYYSKQITEHEPQYFFDRAVPLFGPRKMAKQWYLATIHRAENTDTPDIVYEVLSAFEALDHPVIFPVHPRTERLVKSAFEKYPFSNTTVIQPVGYIDMLFYIRGAMKVITDSGGLQKEAYILQTPCITVRDQTEWAETLAGDHNMLCKPFRHDIIDKTLHNSPNWDHHPDYYGDGNAAERIAMLMEGAVF